MGSPDLQSSLSTASRRSGGVTQCDNTIGAGFVFPAGDLASNKICKLDSGKRYITKEQNNLSETFTQSLLQLLFPPAGSLPPGKGPRGSRIEDTKLDEGRGIIPRMRKGFFLFTFFASLSLGACFGDDIEPDTDGVYCCKECGPNSKPCGDSCIALDKECHKSGGCACW